MMYRSRVKRLRVLFGLLAMLSSVMCLHPNVAARIGLLSYLQEGTPGLQVSPMKANGKIAFTSDRNGFLDVYVMNPDGSNQRQLTFGAVNPADGFSRTYTSGPVWSPDGSKIAFHTLGGTFKIWTMNSDGTNLVRLTDGDDRGACWSPDGTKIVFSGNRDTGNSEIYRMNADGSNQTRLTNNAFEDTVPKWR